MKSKFYRHIIPVEIKLGMLNVPAYGIELMPDKKQKIKVTLNGEGTELSYNSQYRRIFGLTKWYKSNDAQPKDEINVSKDSKDVFHLSFKKPSKSTTEDGTIKEAEKIVDLSGLSSIAKGDIVEDRIKELLLLHGQGMLNVYKPVIDSEGIDLIVVRNGQFHPIFLQIKGRFTLHQKNGLILSIKSKTFNPHPNYFLIGAYFNPKTLELNEDILLVPSQDVSFFV